MSKLGIIRPEIRYIRYFVVFWVVLLGMSVLGELNFSQQSGVLTLSQETR